MTGRVVFFDGMCALCNGFVDFLLRHDKKHRLLFSPLQGSFIQGTVANRFSQENTLVFLQKEQVFMRSSAVLRSVAALGGLWKGVLIFLVIPRRVRDAVYSLIARNRYRWFGKRESCRLPTFEEKRFFLE